MSFLASNDAFEQRPYSPLHRPHLYFHAGCNWTRSHDGGIVLHDSVDDSRRDSNAAFDESTKTVNGSGQDEKVAITC